MPVDTSFYASGGHRAKYILLDKAGKPSFTTNNAATPYACTDFKGIHKWEVSDSKMVQITHKDNDAPVRSQFFAPDEMPTCTLTIGVNDLDINAQLQGVKKTTFGNFEGVDYLTDKMGSNPDVGLFLYRWAVGQTVPTQTWEIVICPLTKVAPKPNAWDRVAQEKSFDVALEKCKKRLWGVTLTEANDGCLESPYWNGRSEDEPVLLFWNADGSEDTFDLKDESGAAIVASNATYIVWDYDTGAELTAGITKTVNDISFVYPPATGHVIVALLEKA